MSVKLINLTPHAVHLLRGDHMLTFEPSGIIARVQFVEKPMGYADHKGRKVAVSRLVIDRIENLPDPRKDIWLIVSAVVQQAAKERSDLLTPFHTRRHQGEVIGCKSLLSI